MKKIVRPAALAALIALNLTPAQAQTNSNAVTFRTNVFLNVAFSLTAYIENITPIQTNVVVRTARPSKIGTKDIINALGTQLGQGTNMLSGAKLLLRTTDLGTSNQVSAFVLRSGTNDTDVSSYLRFNFPSNHRTVSTERFNPKNTTTNSTDYSIMQFTLVTGTGTFNIQGFARIISSSVVLKHDVISRSPFPTAIRVAVAGSGITGGLPAVYQGNVSAAGRKIEIQQVSSP